MAKIETQTQGKGWIVTLPNSIDADFEMSWNTSHSGWLLEPVDVYVLDFKAVTEMKNSFYKLFISFSQLIRKNNKRVASVNILPTLIKQFREDGVLGTFNPVANLVDAIGAPEAPKAAADVKVLNCFVNATAKTFQVQVGTECRAGKPVVVKPGSSPDDLEIAIAGVLGVACVRFNGTIALCFPEKVFLKVYNKMLGENQTEMSAELDDAAAELLNIIYGSVKTDLNRDEGLDLKPSLPTVIRGERLQIRQKTNAAKVVIPFESAEGAFRMEITLEAA